MSVHSNKIPTWLNNAYTESHIGLVLRTLAERESQRDNIRSISRSRAQSSSASSINSPKSSPTLPSSAPVPQYHLEHYSTAIANLAQNHHRNRYGDVVPYDRTRVVVGPEAAAGRYLNANWVLERFGHKWWIATQAPLPATAHTFLSLIFQPIETPPGNPSSTRQMESSPSFGDKPHIRTVVQLTKNVERGRLKAHSYFPTEVGKSLIVPPDPEVLAPALKVTLLKIQEHKDAQCMQSTVAIAPVDLTSRAPAATLIETNVEDAEDHDWVEEDHDERVIFQHLMYAAWPDHGVPEDEDRIGLLAFLKLTDRVNRDLSSCEQTPTHSSTHEKQFHPDPPILVGCSAGIGRTGSFIALSSLLRHCGFLLPATALTPASVIPSSPLGSLPEALAGDLVVEEIDSLREQRPRMVERPEQTLLVYELLIRAFQSA
jgi:protein-tyrosine phosphatase